ncbi:MAG: hypothetical protein J1E37_05690 [Prevotella sp.]|nr:hypothetical protein [Prevotella sp.]
MKKLMMMFVALVCIVATANAQTVYVSTGDGAVAYHKTKSCSYLSNSKNVSSITTAEAKKMGRHECSRCYATTSANTTKKVAAKKATTPKQVTEKKVTTTKKAAEKKTTTTKKTAEKNTDSAKKTATKKSDSAKKTTTTPARDEKGRFIKKAE